MTKPQLMFLGTTSVTFYGKPCGWLKPVVSLTPVFALGVHHKLLGYSTPKDPKVLAERAEMAAKVCGRAF